MNLLPQSTHETTAAPAATEAPTTGATDATAASGGWHTATPRPAVGGRALARRVAPIVALVVLKGAYYARRGPALILDDWHLIYNTQLYGVGHTLEGTGDAVSRPVAWVWFNLVYALAGSSPMRLLVIVTLLNIAIVILLYLLLDRLTTRTVAFWVTAVWVLLPIHTALSVWGGVVQALLSLVLFLAGALWLRTGRWIGAAACFATAALCYQVAIPLAGLAVVALPVEGGMSWWDRAKILAAVGAASLWAALHPTYPTSFQVPDVASLWRAHYGTGLFASTDPPALLRSGIAVLVLLAAALSLVAWWRGRRSWDDGPSVVLLGVVVWAAGLLVLVSTPQWVQAGEFGLTDRVFGLSSMGAAMVFVGIGLTLWRWSPPVAVVAGLALALVCLSGQYVALNSWSTAGDDARALLDHLEEVAEYPNRETFLVGPDYPVRNNVISLENDAAYFAHKLRYPPGNAGRVAFFVDPYQPQQPNTVTVWWAAVSDDLPDAFYAPIAQLEQVTPTDDGMVVTGWAIDRSRTDPIPVELFLDGESRPIARIPSADEARPDLADAYGVGAAHGFEARLDDEGLTRGAHQVCARGVVIHHGRQVVPRLMQCVDVTVGLDPSGPAVGNLDSVSADPSGLHVTGWAIDPATEEPVGLQVFVDGGSAPYGTIEAAANPRPDLVDAYLLGPDHGFDEVLAGSPLASGTHEVCVTVLRHDAGSEPTRLPCGSVTVGAP